MSTRAARRRGPVPPRPGSAAAPPAARGRGRLVVALAALGLTAVVGAIVAISMLTGPRPGGGEQSRPLAGADVLGPLQSISAETFAAVGAGSEVSRLQPIGNGGVLMGASNKPLVFYSGAEYCPFCAAQRWSLVVALSRFGSFNRLALDTSASTDTFPDTPTFSFHGSTYTSQYLELSTLEETDRFHQPLESATPFQRRLVSTYDTPPYAQRAGAIPMVDFGNRYLMFGSSYSPQLLAGLTWQQAASAASDPTTAQGKAVIGSANFLTAAICRVTGEKPADVCQVATITGLEATIDKQ